MARYAQWRHLADCQILWRASDAPQERALLLDKVAAKCCELEEQGRQASIWHALHLVTGNPCHCWQCETARKRGLGGR